MESRGDWADRFRAARKAAGYTAAWRLADVVGASHRQAIRWETGDALPERHRDAIARLSPEFAALIAELPAEDERRVDLARRLADLEAALQDLRRQVEALLEAQQRRPRAQSRRTTPR